eukprot:gene17943-9739_t
MPGQQRARGRGKGKAAPPAGGRQQKAKLRRDAKGGKGKKGDTTSHKANRHRKQVNIDIAMDTLQRLPGTGGIVSTPYLPDALDALVQEFTKGSRRYQKSKGGSGSDDSCGGGGGAASPTQAKRTINLGGAGAETASGTASPSTTPPRTLEAARSIVEESSGSIVPCALNFASAKNPGGGFQRGATAQEEMLCRVSGLFNCINGEQEVYALAKRNPRSGLYHDTCIFSPAVPVIKDDDGVLLRTPFTTSFLTCPAVNAGYARQCGVGEDEIATAMDGRIASLLAVAAHHGEKHLILGAFGTGVFKNAIDDVAAMFLKHLGVGGAFYQRFKSVTFAVIEDKDAAAFATAFHVPVVADDTGYGGEAGGKGALAAAYGDVLTIV